MERREVIERINKLIEEDFSTRWFYEDFAEAYKDAKEIENRNLTIDEMEDLESQLANNLEGFREVIIQEINERLPYLFD